VFPGVSPRPRLRGASWPGVSRRVLGYVDGPRKVREVLAAIAPSGSPIATAADVLRALDVLMTAGLVALRPA
jgi:hypothetical protein